MLARGGLDHEVWVVRIEALLAFALEAALCETRKVDLMVGQMDSLKHGHTFFTSYTETLASNPSHSTHKLKNARDGRTPARTSTIFLERQGKQQTRSPSARPRNAQNFRQNHEESADPRSQDGEKEIRALTQDLRARKLVD